MKIREKLVTAYPTGDVVFHKGYFMKKSKIKIKPRYLLNRARPYQPCKDVLEHLEKSVMLKKFVAKVKKESIENTYMKRIIGCRDFLKISMNFFHNLEKIQFNYKQPLKTETICQTEKTY